MKYGFIGEVQNLLLYRMKYTNKKLFDKVILYFKNNGLHGYSSSYTYNGYIYYIIEVLTPAKYYIEQAKLITIEETIVKLQSKKKEINNTLF